MKAQTDEQTHIERQREAAQKGFRTAYKNLTDREQDVVIADLLDMGWSEELMTGEAVVTMRRRIGGSQALRRYARTLLAGMDVSGYTATFQTTER